MLLLQDLELLHEDEQLLVLPLQRLHELGVERQFDGAVDRGFDRGPGQQLGLVGVGGQALVAAAECWDWAAWEAAEERGAGLGCWADRVSIGNHTILRKIKFSLFLNRSLVIAKLLFDFTFFDEAYIWRTGKTSTK